jgi:uncharacterized ion transporter superfamily protein YfcC
MSDNSIATVLWVITPVAALLAGAALGFARAWRYALLGVLVPAAMAIASRIASNDTLPGSEDMSLRILLVVLAAEFAALFFTGFAVAALLHALLDRLRRRSRRGPSQPRSA